MSFPRYPKYKPSGVEWLGDVPEHWTLPKLKSVASFSGGGTPSRENMAYWNGDIPWVSPKDMKTEDIVGAEESITEEGLRSSASNLLPPGRVLMVVRSGILKHTIPVAINETAVALNQDMKALTFASNKCIARFFLRWVQGHNDQLLLAWAKQGATVESIEHSYLADTVLPLPDVAEQAAIAAFLDRETAKIDGLVAEQQRLMELLKEKRQVVISHAVTKGLNPRAPMKPSGIEWLGDVPAHWEVIKLGLVSTFKGGAGFPDAYQGQTENEIPFFKVGDIVNSDESGVMRKANHTVTRETAKTLRAFVFPSDTIVFAKVGAALLLKRFRELGQPSCIDNNMMGMTAGKNASADFLLYVLPLLDFTLIVNPGAVPSINEGQISGQRIALPPLDEQVAVIEYLNAESAKFDTLTAEAQRAIDLLQERRTALISAAVTGQIDVRGVGCANLKNHLVGTDKMVLQHQKSLP